MNDTLNATLNATAANQTTGEALNQAGTWGLDKLLNTEWTTGLSTWINHTTGLSTTPEMAGALVPIISLLLIYWKWGALMNFVETFGKVIILLGIAFLSIKAMGVL